MLTPILLFVASVLGAFALVLLMPTPGRNLRPLGGLIAITALGVAWLSIALGTDLITQLTEKTLGLPSIAFAYYYVFSFIAIASAVRVITHKRPVYSALWFIMVVLSSSGLLLVLNAEFMAFAMIIIYGGAILVTYMFVIMLASQNEPKHDEDIPEYDRYARDPLWACAAGFLLLAVLLSVYYSPNTIEPNPAAAMRTDAELIETHLADRALQVGNEELASSPSASATKLSNAERVGLDLFEAHPLAIELAGIILLVSLIGAVVIAKTHVPNEDTAAAEHDKRLMMIDDQDKGVV
ncbi:MAG: NADH-quinone oxidoreductase subunit J [Phycisphaeraceae bacterium]